MVFSLLIYVPPWNVFVVDSYMNGQVTRNLEIALLINVFFLIVKVKSWVGKVVDFLRLVTE